MSSDWECLTAVEGVSDRGMAATAAQAFIQAVGRLCPSLPGTSGVFTPLGRVYLDTGQHLEFAARECASPYEFALVCEQIHDLAARSTAMLAERGTRLLLTNNNHSGLLHASQNNIWGAHENYLVHRHPREFGPEVLPFLATRVFGGAGGLEYPSGGFLAGVRAHYMQIDVGGSTTHERALHSLGREEHHMGVNPRLYRYHLLLGDSHRSQFNRATHYGITALALKAIDFDRSLLRRLPPLPPAHGDNPYTKITRRFNRLAAAGEPPRVDPLVIAVQRVYLLAAQRYADSLADPPPWISRLLDDWQAMLAAFEQNDQGWLSARLDPWIKHAWFSEVLKQLGHTWRDVPNNKELCSRLALLDQSYHAFCDPQSAFAQLDRAGALDHRVGEMAPVGSEREPHVPDTITRARPRARLINAHRGNPAMVVDWSVVHDFEHRRCRLLEDPFAQEFGPWQDQANADEAAAFRHIRRTAQRSPAGSGVPAPDLQRRLAAVFGAYEAGRYEDAHEMLEALSWGRSEAGYHTYLRYCAFVATRRGLMDGASYLDLLRASGPLDLSLAVDYMLVYRFQGLAPQPSLATWIERGLEMMANGGAPNYPPALYEHQGAWLLWQGRTDEARRVLEQVRSTANWMGNTRVLGRSLALLAETYRRVGDSSRASTALQEAEALQAAHGYEGDWADLTLLTRAKIETNRSCLKSLLTRARAVQTRTGNRMGLARTLLLLARLLPPRYRFTAERSRKSIRKLAQCVPALAACRLLTKILAQWELWIGGAMPTDERDRFWGL